MKKLYNILLPLLMIGLLAGCELFEAPNETENVQERLISHPIIQLNGDAVTIIDIRNAPHPAYSDAGAVAKFGPTDVTAEMIVSGVESVDPNTPGFYEISYSVTQTNSLGTEAVATATRDVLVLNPDDDASGQWQCDVVTVWGGASQIVNFSSRTPGVYTIDANATMALGIIGLSGTTEIRIAEDVVVMPEHNLAPYSNTWVGNGSVVSRDPETGQATQFTLDWASPQFGGGAVVGSSTYTRL